jgi:homoserine dehydrogenase
MTDFNEENRIYNLIKQVLVLDYNKIISDASIDTILEFNDDENSYERIKYALIAKKNVITSSADVIAKHYVELAKLAIENDVCLLIDPTINMSTIITKAIEPNINGIVRRVYAILDKRCSKVISRMMDDKMPYEKAKYDPIYGLVDTKEQNINELAILAMLCFDSKIDVSKVYYKGLEGLDNEFLEVIDILGYRLRLESYASFHKDEGICLIIEPVVHKNDDPRYYLEYDSGAMIRVDSDSLSNTITTKSSGFENLGSVKSNLKSIMAGNRTKHVPKNEYNCYGNELIFSKYIIKANNLEPNIVDKKIGNIYITKAISGTKINELSNKITFYARIDW